MSQGIWNTIDPTTTSGNQLADYLNDFKDAVVTGFSGTSRPSNLQEGGYWVDTTNDGVGYWSYKMYNGTDDIEIFQINKATGGIVIAASEDQITISKTSDDTIGAKLQLEKKRLTGIQTLSGDTLGDLEFIGNDSGDVDFVQAKISSVSTDNTTSTTKGAYLGFYVTSTGGTALVEHVRITEDGYLGIGTTTPDKQLTINGSSIDTAIKAVMTVDNAIGVDFVSTKVRVTNSGQVIVGDNIGAHKFESTDDAGTIFEAGKLEVSATENHTVSNRGTKVTIDNIVAGEAALSNAISIEDDVTVDRKLIITGDLEVQGTSTTIETATLDVEDANITINKGGDQASADAQDSGFTVEMSDATDAQVGYDSTLTSKFKVGEIGSESEIMDVDSVQNAENKAIIDPSRLDVKKDTEANLITYAALPGTTDGQFCFATDTLTMYQIYDNALQEVGGGGQGGINYIENYNAEKGLDGVTIVGTIPLSLETTTPIFDDQSFKVVSTGTDYQGDIINIASVTMDEAVKYNAMTFTMWVRNPDLQTGDLGIKVYDVDNATYIPTTYGEDIGASLAGDITHSVGFQSTDSVNYEIHMEIIEAALSAFTFIWDNMSLGPAKPAVIGAPVTDWKSYTPTGSWTSNVTYTGQWRRVGDNAEITFNARLSGAPNSASLNINLPDGLTIDTSKLPNLGSQVIIGDLSIYDSGANNYTGNVYYSSTTSVACTVNVENSTYISSAGYNGAVTESRPMTFTSPDNISGTFSVPIAGFSSGVQMSETTMNREISFISYMGTNQSIPSGVWTPILHSNLTVVKDTVNISNGVDSFIIPEDGTYVLEMMASLGNHVSGERYYAVQVNGAEFNICVDPYPTASRLSNTNGSRSFDFEKDDVVKFAVFQNSGVALTMAGSTTSYYNIRKDNVGTQTIAATEQVALIASQDSGQPLATGTSTKIVWNNVESTTHNGFESNGDWIVPANGLYKFDYSFNWFTFTQGTGYWQVTLYNNYGPTLESHLGNFGIYSGGAATYSNQFGGIHKLEKGDIINLYMYQSNGSAINFATSSSNNRLNIYRVGV